MSAPEQNEAKWERRDIDVVALTMLIVLLVIGVVLSVLGSGGVFRFLSHQRDITDQPPPAVAKERADFPQPRLQVSPPVDLEKFRAEQERELTTYGWVDREKNIVRIPIERAIELLSQRGLPQTNERVTPEQLQQQIPAERMQNETR